MVNFNRKTRMGVTEMHAQFWREDGERLEAENAELYEENRKLREELAKAKSQLKCFRKQLVNSNKQCQGYHRLCSKWNLVGNGDSVWTVVKSR